ncbi:MAG: serine/threonine-protein phosphatase, partial [Flaviaesturariibacter sp.]|nr:serine/threonine-protein phosphatase [Flaviaesturariibacter sp.]
MAETIYGITDTGKQRQNNEDAFIAEPVLKDTFLAAGVIDGVGGYEGGEVAAAIAKTTLLNYFSVPSGAITSMLGEALRAANDKILQHKKDSGANDKMACVATLALVEKGTNKFYYAHVGDTRLYLFRDGSLVKITKDQSFVGFLEDSGRISEAEAMQHPKRNEINKALGFEVIPAASDYIETGESPFLPGDILLLCSDGLTDMIDKAKIIDILNATTTLEQKGAALIAAANGAGGKDNITV